MNKLDLHSAIVIFALVLDGCAITPVDGPAYTAAPPPEHGDAIVYIYQARFYGLCCGPTVYIDDLEVFEPRQNAYTWVYIQQGQHKLSINWAWTVNDLHCNLLVKPGESYFIDVGMGPTFWGRPSAKPKLLQQAEAEKELQECCRYLEAVNGHIHPHVPVKVPARFCGGEHWESRF